MINDPIVDETRRIRREYALQFDNNLHKICEDLRKQECASNRTFRAPADSKPPVDAAAIDETP